MRSLGIPPGDESIAFSLTPAIRSFADSLLPQDGAKRNKKDIAHQIYDAILALKKSKAIEGDRDNSPKRRPPKTADDLIRIAMAQKPSSGEDYDRKAGCYEFSALYVAVARRLGLKAVGVERAGSVGTGQIGHIMAGVRLKSGGRLTIFDLQNETRGTRSKIRELGDLEFAAHHYNHLSVAAFLNADLQQAKVAVDLSLLLAPENPSFINNRATVLAATGELEYALADATYASTLQPSVPLYRYQIGRIQLAQRQLQSAIKSFRAALQLRSRYPIARRDLGWALLMQGDSDLAISEMKRSLGRDRKTPEIHLYLALAHLSTGAKKEACEITQKGLKLKTASLGLKAVAERCEIAGYETNEAARLHIRKILAQLSESKRSP